LLENIGKAGAIMALKKITLHAKKVFDRANCARVDGLENAVIGKRHAVPLIPPLY
jgi:hypothetical protein